MCTSFCLRMSSFRKISESRIIDGTKLKNNIAHISSGIPSLDHIIGGGLPSGTIFAVEEDTLGNYSRVLCKYFLSEGVVCKHALFIASTEEDPHEIVKELPQPCTAPPADESHKRSELSDSMKIAWRYESLGQVDSSFGSNTNFGHHFDLSKHINHDTIQNSNIKYWNQYETSESVAVFKNDLYMKLLKSIKKLVSQEEYQRNNNKNKNILRICIQSLGSPVWMAKDCEEESPLGSYGQDLLKFMYCLRIILRDTYAVAFVTIPAHLFDDEVLMKRLQYCIDNSVRIESFAGSSKETNPVYKDYHGLFHVTKLSAVHSLLPFVPPSLDLAFKLRRKKFTIEKLHLPPELKDSSEREQDDITATPPSCGGFKKKDIDF